MGKEQSLCPFSLKLDIAGLAFSRDTSTRLRWQSCGNGLSHAWRARRSTTLGQIPASPQFRVLFRKFSPWVASREPLVGRTIDCRGPVWESRPGAYVGRKRGLAGLLPRPDHDFLPRRRTPGTGFARAARLKRMAATAATPLLRRAQNRTWNFNRLDPQVGGREQ